MVHKGKLVVMRFSGFRWAFFEKGIYTFTKESSTQKGKTVVVECSEEQLSNGDIEFMCENGLTLGDERKAEEIAKYLTQQRG